MGIKIYADGADLAKLEEYADNPLISGFTTNPSLMRKAGIKDYRTFAKTVLTLVKGKPVSFEVLADEKNEIYRQAHEIQSWGSNVWVKIPVVNTVGNQSAAIIETLSNNKINLNVTAVMTRDHIVYSLDWMRETDILSIFVGRIMDTGISAANAICHAQSYRKNTKKAQILWASAREIYNYYQAEELGVDIITLTPELLNKLSLRGKDLREYSVETVKQFYEDGKGLTL